MSPGLTFGTISALFGLNHGIISQAQYSYLVATVIGSAVVPTIIANAFFMPSHLLAEPETPFVEVVEAVADGATQGRLLGSISDDRDRPRCRRECPLSTRCHG